MNDSLRYLHHRLWPRSSRWYPLLAVYYLTYACDFRCPYCSDGKGVPYPELPDRAVSGGRVVAILQRLRAMCNNLELTGGEPLLHPNIDTVLQGVAALDFKEVVLTTNGAHLLPRLQRIKEAVTTLVVSLDTLNPERAQQWYGGVGRLNAVVDAIRVAAKHYKRKLVVSAVVTPENIHDIYDVYEFCQSQQCTFAAYPQLLGTVVPQELRSSDDYKKLFAFLVQEKRKGRPIYATLKALEWMRDVAEFRCHPFTLVAIAPDGDVMYPCLEIGHKVGNVMDLDLHAMRRKGAQEFASALPCGNQCHSACSLGFASLLEHPSTMWHEIRR